MRKIELIVRAVIIHDHQVMLVRKKNRNYSFLPGGHVEFGESAANALQRELKEETGIDVKVKRFLGAIEHAWKENGRQHAEINLIFEAQPKKKTKIIRSLEAELIFWWQDIDQIKQIKLQPYCLSEFLPDWISTKNKECWASAIDH
ncbi:hypothetical protein A2Y85_04695 [candidate division WOR-3 bacterium RBG_13_43_14]|uniref:Nudix hydrolase domain-containing protein n=1 Tax=candidate division WOR-3 bacterium RBG_13_43_14 TaxID=1802590 RepID=A0A1F4UC00_UNCW3|nr:MAG: hypothetical protein A2Y85_04695 [candidate division WOR-3 bacterium RBG_13_43_14]